MSWMRMGWPLTYFKGESKSYVYSDGIAVNDYDDTYPDNDSFCELMATFVHDATGDQKYAEKMLRVLAKKLGIEKRLLKKLRSYEEVETLMDESCADTRKEMERIGVKRL